MNDSEKLTEKLKDKYIFAITGGSGVGKSTVSELFRRRGIYVADADKAARAVVEKGSRCLAELAETFGSGIIRGDGTLDRRALAEKAFSDEKKLAALNAVTHKYILEYLKAELGAARERICAIDGAVIIGSPVMGLCRAVVSVTADRETRIKRITARDKMTREAAVKRIDAQPDDGFYRDRSDYIIENNAETGIDDRRLGVQIEFICNKIEAAAKAAAAEK